MATHPAITATGIKQPLTVINVPTRTPQGREVQVRVEWVPAAPLDVYQVDAGLMAEFPQCLGDSGAGTVVATGPEVQHLSTGDRVFGFFFHNAHEKGQQVYITAPEHLFGKVGPRHGSLRGCGDLPTNFCTSFYTLSDKLQLDLPWPRPASFTPSDVDRPILIWGAGSSVGHFAVQILKYWGYTNVLVTASSKHHEKLKAYGARHAFDYRDPNIVASITSCISDYVGSGNGGSLRVFDTITSKHSSLAPIAKIATLPGSIVAAVLPVVINPASDPAGLQLSADLAAEAEWAPGVQVHPVISYAYEANEFLRDHLQPDIMATLLAQGAIEPNKIRIVDGDSLLERATRAMEIMRSGTVSGERLVWRVWTAAEFPEY
ncbi:alcohol dehydrogenase [Aspergillus pseudoustus]|uniref:Alcohol dehydrogenase n=1 Tax=Aspergillus pseudoustus TaxID=1810923 RepID=A0ABR4JMA7_9EURO